MSDWIIEAGAAIVAARGFAFFLARDAPEPLYAALALSHERFERFLGVVCDDRVDHFLVHSKARVVNARQSHVHIAAYDFTGINRID
jgi:hypothetical protein